MAAHRGAPVGGVDARARAVHGGARRAPPRGQVLRREVTTRRWEDTDDLVPWGKGPFRILRRRRTTPGLQAVLWDMDGLLVDTEPVWTVGEAELAERLGGT